MYHYKKKTTAAALWVLLALVLGALLVEPAQRLWRDMSFQWEEHTVAELKVKEYADEHGLAYSDYPESLIELLERNPETEQFVLEYPVYDRAAFTMEEFIGSDTVPLFLQWDQRWGYVRYGSDVLGITGCGPTCLAMAGFYLTGERRFSPDVVADFAQRNGYYEQGHGSSWTLISQGGEELGLDVAEIPLNRERMVRNLDSGNPIICAVGPGDFTQSGHYILLSAVEDGAFRVNDPNSRKNSDRRWTYEELAPQIRNLWVIRSK